MNKITLLLVKVVVNIVVTKPKTAILNSRSLQWLSPTASTLYYLGFRHRNE